MPELFLLGLAEPRGSDLVDKCSLPSVEPTASKICDLVNGAAIYERV
jgi:hypothetical protein